MDLKDTQQNLLDLMVAFDGICREENIAYSLYAGTLLGAVREKGFIPWDDDMDIFLTREEFCKLEKILTDHPKFHLAGNIKKQFRQKGEHRYWVDIFICDYIDERPSRQNLKQLLLTMVDVMNRDKHTIGLSDFSKHGLSKRLAFKCAYWLGKLLTTNCKINLYKKIAISMLNGNRTLYVRSNDQYKGRIIVFPAVWLDTFQRIPFGNTALSVTTNYHDVLVSIYGNDYMTPAKDDRNSAVHDIVRDNKDITL